MLGFDWYGIGLLLVDVCHCPFYLRHCVLRYPRSQSLRPPRISKLLYIHDQYSSSGVTNKDNP